MQLFGDNSHLNTWTIEKAKEGDRRAQKAIYDALSAKMFPVCLRYMGEREAAEDILQDGFVTLFSKPSREKVPSKAGRGRSLSTRL